MYGVPASKNDITIIPDLTSSTLPPRTTALTRDKIIPACSSMRNCPLKVTVRVENDPIGTWVAAGIGLIGPKDGELLIGAGTGKAEAFIIAERMRIAVAADGLAVFVVVAALVHGVIDVRLPVTNATAGVDTSLTLCTDKQRVSQCG